nr:MULTISPECIES: class I SAM-dependent methyltransferase [Frankia]
MGARRMDAAAWDARYAATELLWGSAPNRFVAAEIDGLAVGRALDLACGEGRNAIHLATLGWHVVGADFSATAVERAGRLAEHAGVADRTTFVVADAVAGPLPAGPFDLVLLAYLQLPAQRRRTALHRAADLLAPGATLLVVAHDSANLTEGVGGPQDPAVLYTADDVTADLADRAELSVDAARRVHRPVPTPAGERTAVDALVRLRRRVGRG